MQTERRNMEWTSSSRLTPAILTTLQCLRWFSGWLWTTDSTIRTPVWWVSFVQFRQDSWRCITVCKIESLKYMWMIHSVFVICIHGCISGLVQSRPGVRIRRVLRQVRSTGLSQTPVLPERPAGEGWERLHDRPHTATLQLCLLRFSRARQQVQMTSFNP